MSAFVLFVLLFGFGRFGRGLEMKSGGYEDLIVAISDSVPETHCKTILTNLEETLTSASHYLFSSLNGKAYVRSSTILLPSLWPDSCAPKVVTSASGETPDITVLPNDPKRGRLWTQQSSGCGQPGDQIYLGFRALEQKDVTLGHSLVKEFAMYRYGVFEEQGYKNDPIYPMCFYDRENKVQVTGCSDQPIIDNGICDGTSSEYNTSKMVDVNARMSIMFAAEAPSVYMFCDDGNHNSYAPTKQNLICERRNTLDVITSHKDFAEKSSDHSKILDTTPKISYKRRTITRYVLILENTKDMNERESWNFLRTAIRKWVTLDLPENTEVGLILTNDTDAIVNQKFLPLSQRDMYSSNRDIISSTVPYSPGETIQAPCLHCALKKAIKMCGERNNAAGTAANVVVLIAPGMNNNSQMMDVLSEAKKNRIKIVTINYPNVIRQDRLDILSRETGGSSYTIMERKANVDKSLLSTYFQLSTILYNIIETNYAGNINDIPLEIYRREIKDNGRSSVTGSFVLEETMGEPAKFILYIHAIEYPLIKGLQLVSPSQQTYKLRSDSLLSMKMITLQSNISENGTWTYIIELFPGNPQSHFLQIMATPKSKTSPIVRAKFWMRRNQAGGPLVLYAEVKRGDYPVLGAKVEVHVNKAEVNGSISHSERFELSDTGSGDPDITKGDGIYTRYYSAAHGGPGSYTFEVTVTDNGNTAYTWKGSSFENDGVPCCGSIVPSSKVEPLLSFQRVLPPITLDISSNEILSASQIPSGRILDLRAEVVPDDKKARLSWTSPDMGGHSVARYELKYASSVEDIADHFETSAKMWPSSGPYPLAAGSETTHTLDFSHDPDLLDKPLFFAVRAVGQLSSTATVSNWLRVFVPKPPPPPTMPPTFSTDDRSSWPLDINDGVDNVRSSVPPGGNYGIQIVLPVVIICAILIAILVLYFCFCVKRRNDHKKSNSNSLKNDKINANITIVPSTPVNNPQNVQQGYTNQINEPDHHTIGVPINNYAYDDEPKKRYSLVQQQEQQLIEELKQQHHQREQITPNYGGLSVISNGTLQRNQPTLSPYSWSASQLLHEHERRHSPLENMMQDEQQMLPQHQEVMNQIDHMSLNGQNMDHVSLNGHQVPEHYTTTHVPPPVPPLPVFNSNGYPVNYNIYGVHQPHIAPNNAIYQTMQRNEALVPFANSLQGSLNSVNSGEKKRRNVTMV